MLIFADVPFERMVHRNDRSARAWFAFNTEKLSNDADRLQDPAGAGLDEEPLSAQFSISAV
jgi:hypothetical protein